MRTDLLESLWASRRGCLSTQVLQEFYVNVVRIMHDTARARDIVQQYLQLPIIIVWNRRTSFVPWSKPSGIDGRFGMP